MSHSQSYSRQQQSSASTVSNLNVQDTEGVTIAGSENVQVTTTDHGAIDAALDIGLEALSMGSDSLRTGADLAGRGLDNALDTTHRAFDFGERVVDSNEQLARDSIQAISDFGGVALGEVTSFARDLTESNLSGLTSLARQTSESADDRVTRTAMYAFAAIAAVFVLPALFKGSS